MSSSGFIIKIGFKKTNLKQKLKEPASDTAIAGRADTHQIVDNEMRVSFTANPLVLTRISHQRTSLMMGEIFEQLADFKQVLQMKLGQKTGLKLI